MNSIVFEKVKKVYDNENVVIPDMNFEIEEGERIVLLGPSGCGKSTLLRMIAGLEEISAGDVYLNDTNVSKVPSGKRNVAMVFQNYALYPHMTVEQNITFGLREKKIDKSIISERLETTLDMLELEVYRNRKPHQLSGGQRQRVALARATVKDSSIFLLDEPLSNLDAQLRVAARQALLEIHHKYQQTMVYVTHDQIEAMTFGTKIILLYKGEIQMYDTPYNVYHFPANIFTAKFIGSPHMNLFPKVEKVKKWLNLNGTYIDMFPKWQGFLEDGKEYTLGIRPENIVLHTTKSEVAALEAKVRYIENQGANYATYLDINGVEFVVISKYVHYNEGDVVYLEFLQEHLHFFDSKTEKNVGRPQEIHEINEKQRLHSIENL